jgi:cyclophilin family peptidyl-prolyl cis-trans isomerase
MRPLTFASLILSVLLLGSALDASSTKPGSQPKTNPILVFETVKGTIEMELFAADVPKSAEHLLALMKRNVYRGQRFHRVTASLVQFGDPTSRDMSRRDEWGHNGTGSPIGVFELAKKYTHQRGTVGLAHSGNPAGADSQLYILKTAVPSYDGKYAIVGRVTAGMAVVDKIAVEDSIKNALVK